MTISVSETRNFTNVWDLLLQKGNDKVGEKTGEQCSVVEVFFGCQDITTSKEEVGSEMIPECEATTVVQGKEHSGYKG